VSSASRIGHLAFVSCARRLTVGVEFFSACVFSKTSARHRMAFEGIPVNTRYGTEEKCHAALAKRRCHIKSDLVELADNRQF
jgi:hypothetical protein